MKFRLQRQGREMNLTALFFHRKKGYSGGTRTHNPRPPASKAVALPTEPPRQPSRLGSNHTSYAWQCLNSPDKQGNLKLNMHALPQRKLNTRIMSVIINCSHATTDMFNHRISSHVVCDYAQKYTLDKLFQVGYLITLLSC